MSPLLPLFLSLVLLCLPCSCSRSNITHFRGVAHTCPYHLQLGHLLTQEEKKEVDTLLSTLFHEIDLLYNHWNPHALIVTDPTSSKLLPILALAHHYKRVTKGKFDPGCGMQLHQFKQGGRLPTAGPYPKTYDLDGMLKGFAIDVMIRELRKKGYTSMCMEWGGDLRVAGPHPSKEKGPLRAGIQSVADIALATSGRKEQHHTIAGITYTDIINPLTQTMLKVAEGMVHTVTVRAPTCALADALATAIMACETIEAATQFAEEIKQEYDIDFWLSCKRDQDRSVPTSASTSAPTSA